MTPSPRINDRCQTYSCWLAARRSQARTLAFNLQPAVLASMSRNPQRAQSQQLAHADCTAKSPLRVSLSPLVTAARVPKSP
jgi:hypothetical protein